MAEYSRTASGSFTSTGTAKAIYLPFAPMRIEMTNYTASASRTLNGVQKAFWDVSYGQGYAVEQVIGTAGALAADVCTLNGFTTFTAGLSLLFGPQQQVVSATKASPAVFTVTGHGYSTGDVVQFVGLYQSATTGMAQICGMPFTVTVLTANTFSINWNTNQSNYTALSGSPSGAYVMKVLNPYLYAPGDAFISSITTGTTTTVSTTTANNFVVGQEIAFRIPSAYGTVQLNELPNNVVPGSPVYGFVTSVTNSTTFVCNINSTGFTAFNSNQPMSSGVTKLQFPQVLAAGDVNTGGVQYSGSSFYPSPVVNGVSTINGPAIQGAFVNNTRQGFVIGTGAGTNNTSSVLVGANNDLISWVAYLDDLRV